MSLSSYAYLSRSSWWSPSRTSCASPRNGGQGLDFEWQQTAKWPCSLHLLHRWRQAGHFWRSEAVCPCKLQRVHTDKGVLGDDYVGVPTLSTWFPCAWGIVFDWAWDASLTRKISIVLWNVSWFSASNLSWRDESFVGAISWFLICCCNSVYDANSQRCPCCRSLVANWLDVSPASGNIQLQMRLAVLGMWGDLTNLKLPEKPTTRPYLEPAKVWCREGWVL